MFRNLIPKIFYDRLQGGLDFFVDGLGFEVLHRDAALAVVARDGAKAYLVESPEYAAKDRPELSVETDDIDAIHAEISTRAPHLLHPEPADRAAQALGSARVRRARPEHRLRRVPRMAAGMKCRPAPSVMPASSR